MGIRKSIIVLFVLFGPFEVHKATSYKAEEEDGGFRQRGLKAHNYFRRLNKANPLRLDQEVV